MDVSDEDIEKIQAYPFKTYAEREAAIAKADKKELARIKRESICKTAQYKLAGNSIVCNVLTHIFRCLFIPNQPENNQPTQLTLFWYEQKDWWNQYHHPHVRAVENFDNAYNVLFHNLFFDSYEKYHNAVTGGIFPETAIDAKAFLEDYFKIDL